MKELYAEYIKDKAGLWSPASIRSESVRLNPILHLLDGDAPKLWAALESYGAYTRTTLWTRVAAFYKWCIENGKLEGPNPYQVFRDKNARSFRNTYTRRPCKQSFDEISKKIDTIEDVAIRNKCRQLLEGGLRWAESFTLEDGFVVGKGNKRREVFVPTINGPMADKDQYSAVLRELKKFGLTPHKLRHARMTDIVNKGASVFELKKIAGWSNIAVAESYVNVREERVRELMKQKKQDGPIKRLMTQLFGWAREFALAE